MLTVLTVCAAHGHAADHAVVLAYHHIAADTPASTSVTPAQFERHLKFIADNGFKVLPLADLTQALARGDQIADHAVAITFDDAYRSVYERALPALRKRGWPFTVFVNTEPLDRNAASHMSWAELREAINQGATVGNHSSRHSHLSRALPGESSLQWRQRVADEIAHASRRIEQQLQVAPKLFAYPYGEYDQFSRAAVAKAGLFGFGQHSGAIGHGSDFLALPRFPLASGYDDLGRLATALNARPLPVSADPSGPASLGPEQSWLNLSIAAPAGPYDLGRLACFASGQGAMSITAIGPGRWSLRPSQPLRAGRTKFNCTAPSQAEAGVFYWWSYLVMKQQPDGSWYDY